MFHHLLHDSSAMQLQRFIQFRIFTEFYVLVNIAIYIISKKVVGTSRDRDQGRTYKPGSRKRKLTQADNEMLKKHTKITTFLTLFLLGFLGAL